MRTLLAALTVALLVGVPLLIIQHTRNSYAANEQLVLDSLAILRELENLYSDATDDRHADVKYDNVYRFQQRIDDVSARLQPWLSDGNPQRRKIILATQKTLAEFDLAAKTYLQLSKGGLDGERHLALFLVKLDSAREKTLDVAIAIVSQPDLLTANSKQHVIHYIDLAFKEQIVAWNLAKKNPEAHVSTETAAVIVVRNTFRKSLAEAK